MRAGALSATARPIPVFIGYDPHERAAVNVLTDSLVQHSSQPLAITPIVARQLEGIHHRARHPSQSTEFSLWSSGSSATTAMP